VVTGRRLDQLPEADRNREIVQFYTRDASWPINAELGFRVADDGFAADIVQYLGRRYKIVDSPNYSPQGRVWWGLGALMELDTV
jgi:hypothetical protein